MRDFYIGWSKDINRKFKSDYRIAVSFESVTFYPVTALLKMWLIKGDEKIEVNSVHVFKDRVYIEDEEQALDFVRFFTEPDLHVFFDLFAIELFPKSKNKFDPYGSVEDEDFKNYGLSEAKVEKKGDIFVISRTLLFYPDYEGILGKRIYIVKEEVGKKGEYLMELSKLIDYDKIDKIILPIN